MLHSLFRHALNELHIDNFLAKAFAEAANFKLELHIIYENNILSVYE